MKRILIVDDNRNNRLFLQVLLDDYCETHPEASFEICEAVNGKEAVEKSKAEAFDLILMDIMMPEMDGVEATRLIRQQDKKVMIIAVSAADDEERKKSILDNGAEDYILKPVNADIFQTRLVNYLALIEVRGSTHFSKEAFNLYSQEVYRRQTIFMLDSEDALSEFWEYFLLGDQPRYEGISDVVRTLSALGDLFVRLDIETRIIVEESERLLYISIDKIDQLQDKLLTLVIAKNRAVTEYKIGSDRMSVMLYKSKEVDDIPVEKPVVVYEEPPVLKTASTGKTTILKSSDIVDEVFDYMDEDDLDEVETYIGKLDLLFLLVGQGEVSKDEIVEIYTYLERIGRMMTSYSESYKIGQALRDLAAEISSHDEEFQLNSAALGPMCAAFSHDLSKWAEMIFHTGSSAVDYMDDTIVANSQTISGMLNMNDAGSDGGDLDDIFDF